jgi:biotin carboxyl carrier protein
MKIRFPSAAPVPFARALAASIALSCSLLAGCGPKADNAEEAQKPAEVAVRIGAVQTRSFRDEVTASGSWRSSGEVDVIAPGACLVQSVLARVGDRVRAGQAVAWLETRESAATLHGAELMVQQAHDSTSRAEARRAVMLARRDAVRISVAAPRAGIVVRRSVEPGSQVADAGEILAIVPTELIVFEARVPGLDRPRLKPGQSATIVVPGFPAITASLQRILPTADSVAQSALVWLAPNRVGPLPGLQGFGTATITIGAMRSAAAIPDSAVVEDDLTGETRVAVVGPGSLALWTRVTLGSGAGGWRELKAPALGVGTRVIIEGQRGLPDSTRVKPAT